MYPLEFFAENLYIHVIRREEFNGNKIKYVSCTVFKNNEDGQFFKIHKI